MQLQRLVLLGLVVGLLALAWRRNQAGSGPRPPMPGPAAPAGELGR